MICSTPYVSLALDVGGLPHHEAGLQPVRTVRSLRVLRNAHASGLVVYLETETGERLALRVPEESLETLIENLGVYELDAFVHGESLRS